MQSHVTCAGQAATGCSTVSASQLESYRNTLLTQCSSVTPQAAGTSELLIAIIYDFNPVFPLHSSNHICCAGGCCSALPTAGTAAWNTFVDCAW